MSHLADVRTSLDVGFDGAELPARFARLRGREWRSIGVVQDFPFEDDQFDVVMLASGAVSARAVRESHRVLRPEGRLFFTVPEKTGSQEGYTLPNVYSLVRDGFNIVGVERPRWRLFRRRNRTLTICAQKKNWRSAINKFRPYI